MRKNRKEDRRKDMRIRQESHVHIAGKINDKLPHIAMTAQCSTKHAGHVLL